MKKSLFVFIVFLFFILSFVSAQQVQAVKTYPTFFNSGNVAAVADKGVATRPSFTLKTQYYISAIANYHWNLGQGASQGTITVVDSKGNTVGSWESHRPGWEPSDKDRWWEVNPDKIFEPGRYTIIDSRPSTWAQNAESGGRGMSLVQGEAIFSCEIEKEKPFGFRLIPEAFARDSGTRFSDLTGEIKVFPDADPTAKKLGKLDMILYVEDHVKTGEDSSAIMSFADMTTFCLGPESEVVLVTPPETDSKIRLVAGNIWANAKKMFKNGSLNIDMTQAVAGIKGTQFIAKTTAERSAIKVIEGSVEFTAKSDGKKIIANAGEEVGATKDGLEEKTPIDPAVLAYYKTLPEKIEGKSGEPSPTQESESVSGGKTTTPTAAKPSIVLSSPLAIGIIILGVLIVGAVIISKSIKKKQ